MSLKKNAIAGVKWTTIGTIGRSIFQLLQVSILARFLPKEAFGLVAMTLFVVNLTNIFVDMGMSSAILHRQDATVNEYSSLYWFNILVSIILYIAIFLGAPLVALFYKEPALELLIPILGVNLLLMATGRQHRTIMQKQFQFKLIAINEFISYFVGLITAIILAMKDFGVYSLVYSTLLSSLISNGLFLIQNLHLNPIKFHFNRIEIKPFLKIGSFSMGSSLLDFFSSEIDILIIGKMLGSESLGIYSLAKQIVQKIYLIVNPIVITVLSPILSSIQKDKDKVKYYYLLVIYHLSSINFPVYLLVIVLSREILSVFFGYNYTSGFLILSFLAIYYCTNTISNPVGSLQIATGRTDLGFKWTIIRVILAPLFIYLASFINVNAVAASIALLSLLLTIPMWKIQLKPMANIKLKEYLKQFFIPYMLFLLISALFVIFEHLYELQFNIIINAIIKASIAMVMYFGFLWVLDKKRIIEIYSLMLSQMKVVNSRFKSI